MSQFGIVFVAGFLLARIVAEDVVVVSGPAGANQGNRAMHVMEELIHAVEKQQHDEQAQHGKAGQEAHQQDQGEHHGGGQVEHVGGGGSLPGHPQVILEIERTGPVMHGNGPPTMIMRGGGQPQGLIVQGVPVGGHPETQLIASMEARQLSLFSRLVVGSFWVCLFVFSMAFACHFMSWACQRLSHAIWGKPRDFRSQCDTVELRFLDGKM